MIVRIPKDKNCSISILGGKNYQICAYKKLSLNRPTVFLESKNAKRLGVGCERCDPYQNDISAKLCFHPQIIVNNAAISLCTE